MELINFEHSKNTDTLDALNAEMSYIVNRAASFSSDKYDILVITHLDENDARSFLLYQVVRIISLARHMQFYVDKRFMNIPWVDKDNAFCRFYGPRKLSRLIDEDKALCFSQNLDITSYKYPRIFTGFTVARLEEIATKLYGFGGSND